MSGPSFSIYPTITALAVLQRQLPDLCHGQRILLRGHFYIHFIIRCNGGKALKKGFAKAYQIRILRFNDRLLDLLQVKTNVIHPAFIGS